MYFLQITNISTLEERNLLLPAVLISLFMILLLKNFLGYIKDNVSIISWKANAAKCKLSVEELIKLADYFAKLKISIDNRRSTHYASTI